MEKSTTCFIAGLIVTHYGLYIGSNLLILLGGAIQMTGALMRCTDDLEKIKEEIRQQKTK